MTRLTISKDNFQFWNYQKCGRNPYFLITWRIFNILYIGFYNKTQPNSVCKFKFRFFFKVKLKISWLKNRFVFNLHYLHRIFLVSCCKTVWIILTIILTVISVYIFPFITNRFPLCFAKFHLIDNQTCIHMKSRNYKWIV